MNKSKNWLTKLTMFFFINLLFCSVALAEDVVFSNYSSASETTDGINGLKNYTVTYTVNADNNRFLLVDVYTFSGVGAGLCGGLISVNNVFYNNVKMTYDTAVRFSSLYKLQNPSVGTNNLSIEIYSDDCAGTYGILTSSFYNVNQTTPTGASNTSLASSALITGQVKSNSTGELIVDYYDLHTTLSTTITKQALQTVIYQFLAGTGNSRSYIGSSYKQTITPNARQYMNWTLSASRTWGAMQIELQHMNSSGIPTWQNNLTNITTTSNDKTAYFTINATGNHVFDVGKYIFGFYNGSTWRNGTATSWTNNTMVNLSRYINATLESNICWQWYINDTYGHQNDTQQFCVQTALPGDTTPPNGSSILMPMRKAMDSGFPPYWILLTELFVLIIVFLI